MAKNQPTTSGVYWQLIGGVSQTIIRIGASMILARTLSPEDFGLFAMAILFFGIFELLSLSGITNALIVKKEPDELDLSTCFWTIIFSRIGICAIGYFLAPIIASFMAAPLLEELIQSLSFLIVIAGFGALQQSMFAKALDFKKIVSIKFFAITLESSLAVLFVTKLNMDYKALILSMFVGVTATNILFLLSSPWSPKLKFSIDRLRYLFRFGLNNMGTSLAMYSVNNIDYLVIGKFLGERSLGFYEFAYRIPHIINERLTGPTSAVVFSTLSKNNSSNEDLLKTFLSSWRWYALVAIPIFIGLALVSENLILFLWGEQWTDAIPLMQILCFGGLINSLTESNRYLFLCCNKPHIPFRFELIVLLCSIIIIPLGTYSLGLFGAAIAVTFVQAIRIINTWYGVKLIGGKLSNLIAPVVAPSVCSICMIIIINLIKDSGYLFSNSNTLHLLQTIALGASVYIFSMLLLFREEFNYCYQLLKPKREL